MALDYGYTVQIQSNGTSDPAAVPTNQWQRKLDGQPNFVDIPGETGETYTIVESDQRADIRLVQSFNGAPSSSNEVQVTSADPPLSLGEWQFELISNQIRIVGTTQGKSFITDPTGQDFYCSGLFDYTFTLPGAYTLPMNTIRTLTFPSSNYAEIRFSPIFDVSNVTNMGQMFYRMEIFNDDISNWNTANVTNMAYMFSNCYAFNQDLSGWCVSKIKSKPNRFDLNANPDFANQTDTQPQWGTCP